MNKSFGLFRRKQLLSERQEGLLASLRAELSELREVIAKFGPDANQDDLQALDDVITNLEELFLIVVAGEFNAGKSSFLNALLGAAVLPEGVTPTTDAITLLRHGEAIESRIVRDGLREHTYPAELLRQLVIVDTPGTNAVIRAHEVLTRNFVPRADLVLFVTSADRPFTESERGFLNLIREWGKKIVLILNKIDILSASELEQVTHFVRENARDLLGTSPEFFPVAARSALRARLSEDPNEAEALRASSQIEAVEHYIVETLDAEERVRLKLISPLGVAERIAMRYRVAVDQRLETLRDDLGTLENIDRQLELFRGDLSNDVQYHLGELDTILRDLETRGEQFFEDQIRLTNLPNLMQSEKLQIAFREQVAADVSGEIDRRVQMMVDWMIEKDLRLWQSTVEYINRRKATPHADQLIGTIGGAFDYNRGTLLENISRTASGVVSGYDKHREAEQLAEDVRGSVAATALAEVGAVGLGALLVTLFSTAALDLTGILAATMLALGGFALLPAKRRQAKQQLREKVAELRSQLRSGVERQFQREVEQSLARVREAIGPYSRFVRARRDEFNGLSSAVDQAIGGIERLRGEINE